MNATKNGQEKTDDAPHSGARTTVTDKCHMEQVESVLEHMHSISCMTVATEVRISPASAYGILTTSLHNEKFVQGGVHICSTMTKQPCMFFLPQPTYNIREMHSSVAF